MSLFALGCASTPHPSSSSIVHSWDYEADSAAVRSAAVAALGKIGFNLPDTRESPDEIMTSWRAFDPATGYATCAEPFEGRVSLRFGMGVQGVRVAIDAEYRHRAGEGGATCTSSGELERVLSRLILEQLRKSEPPSLDRFQSSEER